jgi:hypothetical protein
MIFVIDGEQRPLAPCHSARARRLLSQGKAAVWRHFPFTIMLKRAVPVQPEAAPGSLRLKFDLGSWVTGLAILTLHGGTSPMGSQANRLMGCLFHPRSLAPEGGVPAYWTLTPSPGELGSRKQPDW